MPQPASTEMHVLPAVVSHTPVTGEMFTLNPRMLIEGDGGMALAGT
jgi:hypothetical protein